MMDALFQEMKDCARERNLPILRDSELPLFTGIMASCRPLETGDIVCCICGERDITEAIRGEIPTSSPTGHHSMSDAIVVGVL